jgi:hypothetical protein
MCRGFEYSVSSRGAGPRDIGAGLDAWLRPSLNEVKDLPGPYAKRRLPVASCYLSPMTSNVVVIKVQAESNVACDVTTGAATTTKAAMISQRESIRPPKAVLW